MAKTKYTFLFALLLIAHPAFAAQSTFGKSTEDKVHPHQYDSDVQTVFARTVDTLFMLDWKIKSKDQNAGIIVAKTSRSMRSLGDKVTILVHETKDGRIRVDLTSESGFGFGRNKKNIREFYDYLDDIMGVSR
ncbi:MAG: hypothetical protein ACE5K1_08105 [Acidiferrobacterales bacterium]